MDRKKIIVIGGGFAGIQFVQNLDTDLFDVLLIDKLNYHQFQPLFYQIATAQLEPSSISFPLRKIFQKKENTQIRMTDVSEIDSKNKIIHTPIGAFDYDYLVIATGCKTNFFGNTEIEKHALALKTTQDGIKVRNRVLQSFEDLVSAKDEDREFLLNIVIVGAGPTGVELSGAFAEIKKYILPKDFPTIDFSKMRVILLDGSNHTLNSMSDKSKKESQKYLQKLGVEVITGVFVANYDGSIAKLSNGAEIKSKNVIWAAGITGNIIQGIDPAIVVQNNRIKVNSFNQVINQDSIFALGDISCMETKKYPNGHPQVANVAINQAKNLAKNLKRERFEKKMIAYEYLNLGSMATIGKHKAVVDLPFFHFKGYFAWFVWMFLHLMLILSVRNKLIIFINWAITYFTKDTSLRLIMKENQ